MKNGSSGGAKASVIMIVITAFAGLSLLLYPGVSSWFAQQNAVAATQDYRKHVSELSAEQAAAMREDAREYNESLRGDPVHDPFVPGSGVALPQNYAEVLDVGDGVMAYVVIPSIDVDLPLYHGASEEVLARGLGHLRQTALPIGGVGNRPVVTGHTGLPSAKLFDDLVNLAPGDEFFIYVLDEVLAYRVTEAVVVEPEEIESINAVPGKDLVTLLTCTPYGVNSHRLLVTGERCDAMPPPSLPTAGTSLVPYLLLAAYCALPIGAIVFVALRKPKAARSVRSDEGPHDFGGWA